MHAAPDDLPVQRKKCGSLDSAQDVDGQARFLRWAEVSLRCQYFLEVYIVISHCAGFSLRSPHNISFHHQRCELVIGNLACRILILTL